VAALEKLQPKLAAAILAAPSLATHGETAPDGEVTVKTGGAEGTWIHSRRAPRTEAERLVAEITPKPLQTILVQGMGTGLVPRLLLAKFPKRRVVVLEPDVSLVRFALEHHDFAAAITGHLLVLGTPVPGEPLAPVLTVGAEDMVVFGHVMLAHRYAAQDGRCKPVFEDFLAWLKVVQVSLNTTFVNVHTNYVNALTNLPRFLAGSGLRPLAGCLKGQAAVLVGAGPSLAKNLHVLKQHSGRIHTHVVSSALKRVMAAGVEVHSTNVVDYHHLSVRYFDRIENGPPLIAKPTCHPEVLACYKGPLITAGSQVYQRMFGDQAAEGVDPESQSSNVAHHGYLLLQYMGANPIILMGLDQANTNHVTHSPGTPFFDDLAASSHRFASLELNELLWITSRYDPAGEDVDGVPLTADPQMTDSAHRFEVFFERSPETSVINSTEGGRRLAGAKDMPLAEALRRHLPRARQSIDAAVAAAMAPMPGAQSAARRDIEGLNAYAVKLRDHAKAVRLVLEAAHQDLEAGRNPRDVQGELAKFNALMSDRRAAFELITAPAASDIFRRRKAQQAAMDESLTAQERSRQQLALEHEYMGALETICQRWLDLVTGTGQTSGGESKVEAKLVATESLGTTRSGAPVAIDAFIQWDEVDVVNNAFLGDDEYSPFLQAIRVLCEHRHIRRVLLTWPSGHAVPVQHPKLAVIPHSGGLAYPHSREVRSMYGWNHAGTLRGLSMTTMMGAEGHPLAFLEAQSAVGSPSPYCLVVSAQTGFLTTEVVDSLIERGRTTQWEQGFYTSEGPRGLIPFIYEREAMLQTYRNKERPHAAFLQMANFWGSSYGYLPSEVLRCRRSYHLATPRSRALVRAIAKKLGQQEGGPSLVLADVVAAGNACHSEWVGEVPTDLELELTTERDVTPNWLPTLSRKASMPAERVLDLLEQLKPNAEDINLTLGGHGDPLLHPDWQPIVQAAKSSCARLNVRTFGTRMTPDTTATLREMGVDALTVRLGVWGREAYARANGIDAFEGIANTLKSCLEQGIATGQQVMHMIPEVVKSLDSDRSLIEYRNQWYTPFSWPNLLDCNSYEGAVQVKQAIELYPGQRRACVRLDEQMLVFAGGEVPLCIQDFDARHPVGNVHKTPLTKIWRSPAFEAARAAHAAKDWTAARPGCGACNQWFRIS